MGKRDGNVALVAAAGNDEELIAARVGKVIFGRSDNLKTARLQRIGRAPQPNQIPIKVEQFPIPFGLIPHHAAALGEILVINHPNLIPIVNTRDAGEGHQNKHR